MPIAYASPSNRAAKCSSRLTRFRADFSAVGSAPFTYVAKGRPRPTSYWRLPEAAHDEPDELRRWAALGLEAARRAAAAETKPKDRPAKRQKTRA
jgi:TfoX/Sxy family transcriptional regulator of competence genes